MNILFVNTTDYKGGAAQVAYNTRSELIKRGHQAGFLVHTKTLDERNIGLIDKRSDFGLLSKISKKFTGKDIPSFLYFKSQEIFRFIIANDMECFSMKDIAKTKEFAEADIVHLHNLHGNYFNLKQLEEISKIKPTVWTLHDMWAITGHCSYSYDCKKWEKECSSCPHLRVYPSISWDNTKSLYNKKKNIYKNSSLNIVCPSSWLAEKTKKSILNNSEISVIENGIDLKQFFYKSKKESREKLGLPLDKKIILFVSAGGKRDKRKGWEYIDKMLDNFPETIFLCIGGKGGELEKRRNLKHLPYITDREKLSLYYSSADLFLFTSLAENFPLVTLEAMSCGTPVVSFDVGGVKEAVTHLKNGYIAKMGDLEDLQEGVKYIFSLKDDQLEEISFLSRERVKINFSLDVMVDKYIDLYKKIVKK